VIIDHPEFNSRVELLVGELEHETQAEIVVVAARHSGSYRDVRLGLAATMGLLPLLVALYSPLQFHPANIPLYMLLFGVLGWWVAGLGVWAPRTFTRKPRRQAQVLEAAKATFVEVAVHGTRDRTGILIYVSELERRAVILRDLGLDGHIPGSAWNELGLDLNELDGLEALLRQVGNILAEHIPAGDDNPNEIPNAPRVRS